MVLETISLNSLFTVFTSNLSIILTTLAILLFILYKSNRLDVWEKQGVRGPKPIPIFGNSHEQFFKSTLAVYQQRHDKYGNIYGYYEQSRPMLHVADPEILRHVMVKDSDVFINRRHNLSPDPLIENMLMTLRDEKWKRTRAIMSPTFTSGKLKQMIALIDNCVKSLLENLECKVKRNEEIDVKSLYGAFAMDVIASCAFATKTNAHKNPDDPFVVQAKNFFQVKHWRLLSVLLLPKFVLKALNLNIIPSYVISFFGRTIKDIIMQRKCKNVSGEDFLQLLLDSSGKSSLLMNEMNDLKGDTVNNEESEDVQRTVKLLATEDDDSKLTEDEILAQCLAFFIAGYETSASLLSYASYAMALNPECQELLYKEVKHHFDADGEISYETLSKMKYLTAVINETLRLYTVAIRVEREASRDYKLPNTEITVPKGALIHIPVYIIHHDENNYPDPYAFKPDRFLPENIDQIKPYTFMPFGSGPRNCIGMRFALMEAKLALCNVILRYRFFRCANTDVPLKMKRLTVVVLPVERVILGCESRIQ